jgi:hypothetical protein
MFRNWFGTDAARPHSRQPRRSQAQSKFALTLELLEARTVPATFTWSGASSTDWATAANWNSGTSGVPGANDDVVINTNNPLDPTLSADTTIGSLTINSGTGSVTVTLNANLSVNGALTQNAGALDLGGNTLTVDGNVAFNGGETPPSTGTLVMAGRFAQSISNSSGLPLPDLTINNPLSLVTTTGSAFSVTGLTVLAGVITLSADMTDSGDFIQGGGTVSLRTNALNIAGNVTRTGGNITFTGLGDVVLDGAAGQTVMDSTFTQFPNLTISNTSTAGVTIPGSTINGGVSRVGAANVTLNLNCTLTLTQASTAAFLVDSGTFTDNGKVVLNQLTPNGSNPTALVKVTGGLALSASSAFDLSVAAPSAGAVYSFITYGSVTGAGSVPAGNIVVHGNAPFAVTPAFAASALTVTLASPGIIDTWTGGTDSTFANGANWSAGAAPGASDLAVIANAPNDLILSGATTVGSLEVIGGFLTLNATLTVTGNYSQDAGFLAFGTGAQLQIAGNVVRTGGVFLGAVGTVVLDGTNQSITDTSGHAFGWDMVVNSGTAVTVQAGSVLSVADNLTNDGTVNLSMASPASATPLAVGNNLVEGAGSVFNLALGDTSAMLSYIFITFGGTETTGATFNTNAGSVLHKSNSINVTT